jgi:Concanavalin A-like lectin/glucanases superfamily
VTVYPKQTMLVHRYSFANDASDSVGAQNGMLFGNALISGGQAVFDGDGNSYVELPQHMISTYDSVTLEAWATFDVNAVWCRLYDFGHYGADGTGAGRPYVFLCPHTGGGAASIVLSDGTEAGLTFSPTALDGLNNLQVVVVYDPPSNTESVYTNGVLAGSATLSGKILAGVDDLKCWLGRSMYAGDNGLTGSIDEFRIYAGAFTAAQISADYAAGPNTVVLPSPTAGGAKLHASVSGSNLVISWLPAGGHLESNAKVNNSAGWTTVGTANPATIPLGAGPMFFRVATP